MQKQNIISLPDAIRQAFSTLFKNENIGYFLKVALLNVTIIAIINLPITALQDERVSKLFTDEEQSTSSSYAPSEVDTTPLTKTNKKPAVFGASSVANFGNNVLGITTYSNLYGSRESSVLSSFSGLTGTLFVITLIFTLVSFILSTIPTTALAILPINIFYRDLQPVKEVMKRSLKTFIGYYFVIFLQGLIVLIGFLLFIIPGVIFAIRFMFAPYIYLKGGVKPVQALKESFRITKNYSSNLFFKSLGLFLFALLIAIPGTLISLSAGSLGTALLESFSTLIVLSIYQSILDTENPPVTPTPEMPLSQPAQEPSVLATDTIV